MTPVRLVIDVDGEVYPELHAALVRLLSEAARGERLRQLAASGLVWEGLRRQAAPAPPSLPSPTSTPMVAAAVQTAASVSMPAAALPQVLSGRPTASSSSPDLPRDDGFVDLALDAAQARSVPPRAPPLLVDVIGDAPVAGPPVGLPTATVGTVPGAAVERPLLPADAASDAVPDAQAATRQRLQRMKDRGLFRNG